MGNGETGARNAVPVFQSFMSAALADTPPTPFRIPAGVRLVRVDSNTGMLPGPTTTDTILEAFKPDTEPTQVAESSPFVFGGSEPIDPRVLSGVDSAVAANPTPPPSNPAPRIPNGDDLGGLY
jgi:penicillin-binding protein 1A